MTTNDSLPNSFDDVESRSSVFAKLPADFRLELHHAIIDREPPTYRALYFKFNLADHGVSFTAFYRYARRLRHQADLLDLADLAVPENADVPAAIHTLMSHRLLDSLLHDESSPNALHRLAESYRIATASLINLQRQKEILKEAVRKEREHDTECFRKATADFRRLARQQIAGLRAHYPVPAPDQPQSAPDEIQSPP